MRLKVYAVKITFQNKQLPEMKNTSTLQNQLSTFYVLKKKKIGHTLLQKNNMPGPQLEKGDIVPVSDADLQ